MSSRKTIRFSCFPTPRMNSLSSAALPSDGGGSMWAPSMERTSSTWSTRIPIVSGRPPSSEYWTTMITVWSVGLAGGHPELEPEVHDRDHLAAQVDDAADELAGARDAGDLHQADDLPHLQDLEAVLLLRQLEGHVLPGQALPELGRWAVLWGGGGRLGAHRVLLACPARGAGASRAVYRRPGAPGPFLDTPFAPPIQSASPAHGPDRRTAPTSRTGAHSARPSTPPRRSTGTSPEPLELELGGRLERVRVGYRTWGRLAPDGRNAVVVCHALTGTADVDSWWARMFGPGRAFDPDRDFVVCANILGSCYGTTGPTALDPATGRAVPRRLPADHRAGHGARPARARRGARGPPRADGHRRLARRDAGAGVGAALSRSWSARSSSSRAPPATRRGRSASPRRSGRRSSPTRAGAAGRYDPRDPARRRAGRRPHDGDVRLPVRCPASRSGSPGASRRRTSSRWRATCATRGGRWWSGSTPPPTWSLTEAMDTHDVARGRGDFEEVLRSIRQPTLVVSIDSDVLVLARGAARGGRLVPSAKLAVMDSPHGHDAFLIDVDRLSEMVADFRGEARARSARGRPGRRPCLRGARHLPRRPRQGEGRGGAARPAGRPADRAGAGLRRGAARRRDRRPARDRLRSRRARPR